MAGIYSAIIRRRDAAPLAEQGIGATYEQYYIVENAFDLNSIPEIYFYFLNKDVVPIGSKTL
ncbi:MAG: hypothetical protein CMF38_01700 [Legionellaceae bacterium]|nr:hypothetical protein [Legionellaceae bacterium]|tara:strand:+ start:3480 stop:3665 length:186 start_codon:yes stop_codon:yes gene_type:complete